MKVLEGLKGAGYAHDLLTFQFIEVEGSLLLDAVLNPVWLNAVRALSVVLEHHLDGVLLLHTDHRT